MRKLILASTVAVASICAMPAIAEEDEYAFIDEFLGYLEISEQFLALASRTEAAVFFAMEGIVEIHEARGEQAQAIPELQSILEMYPENQAVRNLVRFKLRDLYRETGQTDAALNELRVLIDENK
ncbi:MAG: hypothetical protein AAGG09_12475 [Pseudomonadota bacterium]